MPRRRRPATEVLVVGAGPTGLTAALILAKHGVRVRLVDRSPAPVADAGVLVVRARTLELLDKLELADAFVDDGQPASGLRVFSAGKPLLGGRSVLDLGPAGHARTSFPMELALEQDRAEALLAGAVEAAGVQIEHGVEIQQLGAGAERVVATGRRNGRATRITADWVIGADGACSPVRHAMGVDLVGGGSQGSCYVADVAVDWQIEQHDLLVAMIGRSRGLGCFVPLPDRGEGGRRYRVIGDLPADADPDAVRTIEDVQRQLDPLGVPLRVRDPKRISGCRRRHRMAESFRVGRLFVAGDAAHIDSTIGGQGTDAGIQDAFNLAWKLAAVVRGFAGESLLDSYAAEREPVAKALLDTAERVFDTARDPRRLLLARAALQIASRALPGRALGRRAFAALSQTDIQYPRSAVVDGARHRRAGPGMRAPHAVLEHGPRREASILELMRGLEHHLLVFAASDADQGDALRAVVTDAPVPITVHRIRPDEWAAREAYGVRDSAALLVRPDGHIGWRGGIDDPMALAAHLDRGYRPGGPA